MSARRVASVTRESGRWGGLVGEALLALACVLVLSYLGVWAFAAQRLPVLTLGPLAGVVAALAVRRPWWLAGPLASAGVMLGSYLGWTTSPFGPGRFLFPGDYWIAAAVALVVGTLVALLLDRREDLERWVVWGGVALVIFATCVAGWMYSNAYESSIGNTPVGLFRSTPVISANTVDEQLFVLTVRRMTVGMSYYDATAKTLVEHNQAGTGTTDDTSKVMAWRMPTLYWFLAALPQDGASWVIAMLALVSAAIVAAWTIAARFVRPAIALTGTALVGVYLAGFTTINIVLAEEWAGLLGLIAVALAVKSLSVKKLPLAWAAGAASVALMATLVRELALPYLLVGLAATLVAERTRARRLWLPWAVALGLAALAYAGHVLAVTHVASTLPAVNVASPNYFDPTGRGISASVALMLTYALWPAWAGWIVWALGTAGGLIAPKDWPRRVMLAGISAGGAIALFFTHTLAALGSPALGFWGIVVLPTVVACAPLAFAAVPWMRRGQ